MTKQHRYLNKEESKKKTFYEIFRSVQKELVDIAISVMGDDFAHGWPHVLRVQTNALRISKEVGIKPNRRVLESAILLHDIGRFSPDGGHHAVKSAEMAVSILKKLGYSDSEIDLIKHAILAHSYSLGVKAKTLEAKILSDADKLDALGAIGIARVFHTGCKINRTFEDSIAHFIEKLVKLPDLMYLDVSKRLAKERVKIVLIFIEEVKKELAIDRGSSKD